MKKPIIGELDDGSELFYISHEFRDTDAGCDVALRLLLPTRRRPWFSTSMLNICPWSSGEASSLPMKNMRRWRVNPDELPIAKVGMAYAEKGRVCRRM